MFTEEFTQKLYQFLLETSSYMLVSLLFTAYFYYYRRKDLLGGFTGGFIVAFIGAILFSMLVNFRNWFNQISLWLLQPSIGEFSFHVNFWTASIGSVLFLLILNHINYDRDR